tara:strand:+ start:2151 stop:2399 length:249 start_codon:yes stop_codon:yes gene_type:complete
MLNSMAALSLIYPQLSVNKTKWKRYVGNPAEYSQADKNRALRLVTNGMKPKDAAKEIGCGLSTLNLWRKAAKDKLENIMVEA